MATEPCNGGSAAQQLVYVTLGGLPLRIELEWPFRRSGAGADFYMLHGSVRLESGAGLHCLVAVQMTLTMKDVLPSLEPADVEAPVINTLRKEIDRKQLEFLKSPKRVPVPFSGRQYSFKRQQWDFARATDDQVAELVRREVYWNMKLGAARVWIADPTDAQYVTSPASRLIEAASRLGTWLRLEGEYATATPELLAEGPKIEADMRTALEALEKKHAFERG
ncbi:MAG TPA: hypothetical protein VMT05_09910 [Terriglobales bacterium]|jgi:hypothetical protein|nr:hypothetical protein [Terriglobales bacterium]